MPLYVNETVNSLTNRVLEAPFMRSAAKNPVITAVAITIFIMFVILIVFRDTESVDSLSVMVLRSGFWSFMGILGFIILHNKILHSECGNITLTEQVNEVFERGGNKIPRVDGIVPVRINTDFTRN